APDDRAGGFYLSDILTQQPAVMRRARAWGHSTKEAHVMFRLSFLVAAILLSASCAPQQRDPLEEGARLMGELRMASGGAALDAPQGFHETGTVVANGETSTYETWGDFYSLRWSGTRTAGGVTRASGFDGRAAWTAGADGVVQTDTSPEALANARLGAYLTNAAYLYPDRFPARFEYKGRQESDGVAYDVVTVTPADSVPIDFWLDVETHRLARLSGMDGDTPFLGIVQRYKEIDGVLVMFASRQRAGDMEMLHSLTLYEFIAVPEARLAQAASR
ncbi:MAG: hypothetical protein ACREH4_04415, partial [Vitreimonas sp.]